VAEPNLEGKPSKKTWAKVFLVFFVIAVLMFWMTCASLGLPFP